VREDALSILIADSKKIRKILNWKPLHDNIEYMIKTAWEWEKKLTFFIQGEF